jgi:hypothetical protein
VRDRREAREHPLQPGLACEGLGHLALDADPGDEQSREEERDRRRREHGVGRRRHQQQPADRRTKEDAERLDRRQHEVRRRQLLGPAGEQGQQRGLRRAEDRLQHSDDSSQQVDAHRRCVEEGQGGGNGDRDRAGHVDGHEHALARVPVAEHGRERRCHDCRQDAQEPDQAHRSRASLVVREQ